MSLNVNTYIVPNETKRLFIIHGICEHSKRYEKLAKKFNKEGISVITYDLRGHGKSAGKRGYIKNFRQHIDDFIEIEKRYHNEDVKQYLLGHSMGGLIGHMYMVTDNTKMEGYIASGAPTDFVPDVKPLRIIGYKWFGFIKKSNDFGENTLSHDRKVEEDYNNDPLVLKKFYIRLAGEMFIKGVKYLNKNIKNHQKPILFLHGKEDKVVPYTHTVQTYEKIQHEDKKMILYENMYHEILNEVEKDKVFNDIMEWLNER